MGFERRQRSGTEVRVGKTKPGKNCKKGRAGRLAFFDGRGEEDVTAYLVHEGEREGEQEEAKTRSCERRCGVKDVVKIYDDERRGPVCLRKIEEVSEVARRCALLLASTHTSTRA